MHFYRQRRCIFLHNFRPVSCRENGKTKLLLIGATGMCISQLILAALGITISSTAGNNALIALVCVYIFFLSSRGDRKSFLLP